jgi:hypothetical protein
MPCLNKLVTTIYSRLRVYKFYLQINISILRFQLSFETIRNVYMVEKLKPFLIRPGADAGGSCYWDGLREGYRLAERYRNTLAQAEKDPMYDARGYNQDGEPYGIHENLAPWDAVDEEADALARSKSAVSLLKAHKFSVEQVSVAGGFVIRNPEGNVVSSREMPIFIQKRDRAELA